MSTTRLEAFSDGVMAILITLMAFEVKRPEGTDLQALSDILPTLLVFILSFVLIGTYWNNHHHLMRAAKSVTPAIMWANLHLLLWLCLVPIGTAWVGTNYLDPLPAATYSAICLLAGWAYWLLTHAIIAADKPDSDVRRAIGSDAKGNLSVVAYAAGVPLAFVSPFITYVLCAGVLVAWLIPDRRLSAGTKA